MLKQLTKMQVPILSGYTCKCIYRMLFTHGYRQESCFEKGLDIFALQHLQYMCIFKHFSVMYLIFCTSLSTLLNYVHANHQIELLLEGSLR